MSNLPAEPLFAIKNRKSRELVRQPSGADSRAAPYLMMGGSNSPGAERKVASGRRHHRLLLRALDDEPEHDG